jgi:hypothetical protein
MCDGRSCTAQYQSSSQFNISCPPNLDGRITFTRRQPHTTQFVTSFPPLLVTATHAQHLSNPPPTRSPWLSDSPLPLSQSWSVPRLNRLQHLHLHPHLPPPPQRSSPLSSGQLSKPSSSPSTVAALPLPAITHTSISTKILVRTCSSSSSSKTYQTPLFSYLGKNLLFVRETIRDSWVLFMF